MTDFIEKYRPRHEALETLRSVLKSKEPVFQAFAVFRGTQDTAKTRPDNLLDLYLSSYRELFQDASRRPEHYADNIDILDRLKHRPETVTPAEKNTVFMLWHRPSALEAKTRAKLKDITQRQLDAQRKEDQAIILSDGRSLADHLAEPSFESQDFGDKVII